MNSLQAAYTFPSGQRLEIVLGDLTTEVVDAIVNAANAQLMHGGGVAGAIVRRGGWEIQEESSRWVAQHGPVSHAEPAYTGAGRLSCRYVIHAVGPVWGAGNEDAKLEAAVQGSLWRAGQLGLKSLAIPPISTGIFGFPKDRAARIFLGAIPAWFANNPASSLELIRLVMIDQFTLDVFLAEFKRAFSQ